MNALHAEKMLFARVDGLLNERLRSASPKELLRARLAVAFSCVTLSCAMALAIGQVFFGSPWIVACIAIGALAVGAALWLLRARGRVRSAAQVLVATWMLVVCSVVALRGGVERSVTLAFVVPLLLSLILLGRRAAVICFAAACTFIAGTGSVQLLYGPWLPTPISQSVELHVVGDLVFLFGVFGIGSVFETLRERADEEFAQQQSALAMERTGRLSSLGTLAAGMAHEINNPLNNIYGTVSWLLEESALPTPDELRPMLVRVQESAERIKRILADMGNIVREANPSSHPTELDVAAVLEETLNMLRHELDDAEVIRRYGQGITVRGERTRMSQIFLNVLANAVYAVRDRPKGRIEVSIARAGVDQACIEVHDSGPGFTEEARRRAFEPFFTTKPEGQGSGLGLWVASSIAARAGGRIEIDPGGPGARVRIVLPV